MSIWDWIIVIIPLSFVLYMAFYSRRYIKGVVDFLAAGRVCGRYVISVADVASAIAVITLVSAVEANYKTGFALAFWQSIMFPITLLISLSGYCIYRYRETKAMSLGQFLEIRYNRKFRIFAASLRTLAEMITNMICPAIAARFFIYLLDLPLSYSVFGITFSTFGTVMILVLTLAIYIIWNGGTLALIITDTIQGLICYPIFALFTFFVLWKFSWNNEVVPVLFDRVPGESFLNPFDISQLRDFNLFSIFVIGFSAIVNYSSWIGAGATGAGKNPHEQKMANVMGAWRNGFSTIFYVVLAITVITVMNHVNYSKDAFDIRMSISSKISKEVIDTPQSQEKVMNAIKNVGFKTHKIGVDAPQSQNSNMDTIYLNKVLETLSEDSGAQGKAKFQEFRTLYNQMLLPSTMRAVLPTGLIGLFALLMVLVMLSTDDSRIFSSALTTVQDVIMPLKKEPLTPQQHIKYLRIASLCVGVFFWFGSYYMSQMDYITMFAMIVTSIWLGGAGPVMIFGLYSKFGNTIGAFAALITGAFISVSGIILQRNWADTIYPFLENAGWVDNVNSLLYTISSPFAPYIIWEMNPIKFPINSIEVFFISMICSIMSYVIFSLLFKKENFNLDRMLHRGIYNLDNEKKDKTKLTLKNIWSRLIGITSEYSKGDKAIAWSVFIYTFVYQFLLSFIAVIIWNYFYPLSNKAWSTYFLVVSLLVPGVVAIISTVWFTVGGYIDMRQMFKDLAKRTINNLDDGRVDGHVSLADKVEFEKIDKNNMKDKKND